METDLQNGLETGLVVVHVFLHLSALHVKHVDEHLHVAEHVVTLSREIVLHKDLLSTEREEERGRMRETEGERGQ